MAVILVTKKALDYVVNVDQLNHNKGRISKDLDNAHICKAYTHIDLNFLS